MSDDTEDEYDHAEAKIHEGGATVGSVVVFWKGEAAEVHGEETEYGGIEWVSEHQDRIILIPRNGTHDEPPRITIYREDICGFHELSHDL